MTWAASTYSSFARVEAVCPVGKWQNGNSRMDIQSAPIELSRGDRECLRCL
ncbi:hypothetical protein I547_5725 [Mycobacterium kansasii 824]|nr:hypothetical protein I547_5725 [Mycobacterium kansasii 824]